MALTKGLGGGGGGGAPTSAEYLVGAADGTLSAERVVTDTATVAWDLATSGQAKANVPNASLALAKLSATGTPSSSNFLRGDNTWAAPTTTSSRAYWMVVVEATQGAGSNARIGELQLRATSGGSNIATGGTAIFLDQASGSGDNSAAAAFDGNSATAWASAGTTMPSGVGYQLPSASAVNEIVIVARNDGFGPNGAPARFTLYSSSDGVSYQREWSVLLSTGWTAGLSRTFTRPT